jgi:CheY-like chemotaxis protein
VKTIMVADDDGAVREVLRELLEVVYADEIAGGALQVVTAEDGEAAVTVGTRERPSLVLMDINMPKLDGIEAFYRLREHLPAESGKTLFITGYASSCSVRERIDRAVADGALGWLSKPVTADQLTAVVAEYVLS